MIYVDTVLLYSVRKRSVVRGETQRIANETTVETKRIPNTPHDALPLGEPPAPAPESQSESSVSWQLLVVRLSVLVR